MLFIVVPKFFSIVFVWLSFGFLVIFQWFVDDFQCCSFCFAMVGLWFSLVPECSFVHVFGVLWFAEICKLTSDHWTLAIEFGAFTLGSCWH